ncbi:hypothetical protein DPMN_022270 [Dreissena polymorpha]|uniref:Uncharacterized protein n=1 Tax=Dreissena polymorpha TaxID=45954 RepID=A0A9D4NNL8_DREPO|nr:hypothetical protein DPMN_022270 [Dreissena polymorpha]
MTGSNIRTSYSQSQPVVLIGKGRLRGTGVVNTNQPLVWSSNIINDPNRKHSPLTTLPDYCFDITPTPSIRHTELLSGNCQLKVSVGGVTSLA